MLTKRLKILQRYSENTKEKGEMYYIYDVNSSDSNSFYLCICEEGKSHEVITKSKKEIGFVLDYEGINSVGKEINTIIKMVNMKDVIEKIL